MPGDYSLNGVVDAADYNLWRDSFLSEGADLMADGNGNGRVDTPDYVIWRDARQAATQTVSVPEPWGAALMIAALAVALGWGRSGHRG